MKPVKIFLYSLLIYCTVVAVTMLLGCVFAVSVDDVRLFEVSIVTASVVCDFGNDRTYISTVLSINLAISLSTVNPAALSAAVISAIATALRSISVPLVLAFHKTSDWSTNLLTYYSMVLRIGAY